MSPRAGCDKHQSVDAYCRRLARKANRIDIGKDQPAIAVHGIHDPRRAAERGNHEWRLVPENAFHIGRQATVGRVNDQIRRPVRSRGIIRQCLCYLLHPVVEYLRGPRIGRRKAADHAGFGLRNDHLRS